MAHPQRFPTSAEVVDAIVRIEDLSQFIVVPYVCCSSFEECVELGHEADRSFILGIPLATPENGMAGETQGALDHWFVNLSDFH